VGKPFFDKWRRRSPLYAGCILLTVSGGVFAAGIPTNFAALPNGSWVVGSGLCPCYAANGNFVRAADLLTSQENLEEAILAVGKVLNTGQMQQMTATERELNQVLQEETAFQKQLHAANSYVHAYMQTTDTLVAKEGKRKVLINQPGQSCNEESMARSLGQGMVVNRHLAVDFGKVLVGYDRGDVSAMASLKNLANAPTSTLSASSIFPSAITSSVYPTPEEAAKTIAHLTEPIPPVKLTKIQKKNGAGIFWEAHEKALHAKMSMAQDALSTIAAWHQPTIKATYFVKKWKSMQGKKKNQQSGSVNPLPPGVNDKNRISPDGALNLMIEKAYANPHWYSQLAIQNETGAIKDLAAMEAVSLRVHWEELRMSEYLAALSADQYAQAVVTPTNRSLTLLNGNAMAQKNGAFNGK